MHFLRKHFQLQDLLQHQNVGVQSVGC